MSELSRFLKKNQIKKDNLFYPATAALQDENGDTLLWEIKALSAREMQELQSVCVKEVPSGKGGCRQVTDPSATARICAAAVVYPDLNLAELQDSYGVTTPHELLLEMLGSYGEFNAFASVIFEHSGLKDGLSEEVEKAKN